MDPGEFFRQHGWVVVRGVVSPKRVAELERAFDQVFPPAAWPKDGVLEVPGLARRLPGLGEQVFDGTVSRIAAGALGCARVQLLQDVLMLKPPRTGGRVEWHQDRTYIGYLDPPRCATARLALSPCTQEMGCMRVLDGSHDWGFYGRDRSLAATSVDDALGLLPPERRAPGLVRMLELEPGDLSLHHCLTFHGSLENRSKRARKTLIVRFFDADCRVSRDALPAGAASWFPARADGGLSTEAFPLLP